MDTRQLLTALAQRKRDTETELAALREQIGPLEDRLRETDQQLLAVRSALRALGEEDLQPADDTSPAEPSWQALSRTEAIVAALAEVAPKAISPLDLVARLHTKGRTDEYNAVSAALAYLKRRRRVTQPSRGSWTVASTDPSESDEDEVVVQVK